MVYVTLAFKKKLKQNILVLEHRANSKFEIEFISSTHAGIGHARAVRECASARASGRSNFATSVDIAALVVYHAADI